MIVGWGTLSIVDAIKALAYAGASARADVRVRQFDEVAKLSRKPDPGSPMAQRRRWDGEGGLDWVIHPITHHLLAITLPAGVDVEQHGNDD